MNYQTLEYPFLSAIHDLHVDCFAYYLLFLFYPFRNDLPEKQNDQVRNDRKLNEQKLLDITSTNRSCVEAYSNVFDNTFTEY